MKSNPDIDIKALREGKHLTQEELAEQSGLSVRTIQRIEAGQEPKGHTAKALAKTLGLTLSVLNGEEESIQTIDYSLAKRINLSSAFVCFIPLLNIILPLVLSHHYKQKNSLIKSIITIQILWSIISTLIFFLAGFLKITFSLPHRTPFWTITVLILINLIIIITNTANIDKNKALYFKFNFNLI